MKMTRSSLAGIKTKTGMRMPRFSRKQKARGYRALKQASFDTQKSVRVKQAVPHAVDLHIHPKIINRDGAATGREVIL